MRVMTVIMTMAHQVHMKPVCIYLASTTEASVNPTDYRGTQGPTSSSTPRLTKEELPLHQAVCHWLTFSKTPPSEMDSSNKEDFPTALSVWCKEPVSNRQWLYIHLIPCSSITGHTPRPATHPHELFMKRYPQKQNWWMPQCQMTYQMSLILPKNNFTQIIYLG